MPLIRVTLVEWSDYQQLKAQIEDATTIEELRTALVALLNYLQQIEYIGEAD